MQLTSVAFENGQLIPTKYTCDGEGVHPPLEFKDIPEEAETLAIIMEDPDVPKEVRPDGKWLHWMVWNIPANISGLKEGEAPHGAVGKNTSGNHNFAPPCPPDRQHRYFFNLYALKGAISLPEDASKEDLLAAMEGSVIATAELMGVYERPDPTQPRKS